jgi:hypothetical protein
VLFFDSRSFSSFNVYNMAFMGWNGVGWTEFGDFALLQRTQELHTLPALSTTFFSFVIRQLGIFPLEPR